MFRRCAILLGLSFATISMAADQGVFDFKSSAARLAVNKHKRRVEAAKKKFDLVHKRIKAAYTLEVKDAGIELMRDLDLAMSAATKAGNLDEAVKLKGAVASMRESVLITPSDSNRFPNNALAWNGHHYKLIEKSLTWNQANVECQRLGGHLVRIESAEESRIILSRLLRNPKGMAFWIDGSDEVKEGQWQFTHYQKLIRYFNWGDGEPGNLGRLENHVAIALDKKGQWIDAAGSTPLSGCVCEWDF